MAVVRQAFEDERHHGGSKLHAVVHATTVIVVQPHFFIFHAQAGHKAQPFRPEQVVERALVESGKVGGRGVESPVGHVGRDGHVQCKSHSHRADGCVGLVEHGVHELTGQGYRTFRT